MTENFDKNIKEQKLIDGFKDFIPQLKEKYSDVNFSVNIDYSQIKVNGKKDLEKYINNIFKDIIDFAQTNIDEVYQCILNYPAVINNIDYIYSLERVIKEEEKIIF